MKKLLLATIFLLSAPRVFGQHEFYLSWSSNESANATDHYVDHDGNTYVLATLTDTVFTTEGFALLGNAVFKIDDGNNLVWKKQYNNFLPGNNIFELNSCLWLAFDTYFGLVECSVDSTGAGYAQNMSLNSIMTISEDSGDTLKSRILHEGKPCGLEGIEYCYVENGLFNLLYSSDSSGTGYGGVPHHLQVIDSGMNSAGDNSFAPLNDTVNRRFNNINAIFFDSFSRNLVVVDNYSVRLYDNKQTIIGRYSMDSFVQPYRGIGNVRVAANANFYAISCTFNYDGISGHNVPFVITMTKAGSIISVRQSLLFNDIVLTEDNSIFGVSSWASQYGIPLFDTVQKPVTVLQMDLFQNVKRRLALSIPGVIATKISVFKNDNLVVTGTYKSIWSDSFRAPNQVYYFTERLEDIPPVSAASDYCGFISVFPNPVQNFVSLSSLDFNSMFNAHADIYDILGRKLDERTVNAQTISFDMARYPPGVYIIKVKDASHSCSKKIVKNE